MAWIFCLFLASATTSGGTPAVRGSAGAPMASSPGGSKETVPVSGSNETPPLGGAENPELLGTPMRWDKIATWFSTACSRWVSCSIRMLRLGSLKAI